MALAEESVMIGHETDEETGPGLWERFKQAFSTGSEYVHAEARDLKYERRLWDRRIEKFLDARLPQYLRDFGVLDEVALHVRDERVADLTARTGSLLGFVQSFGRDVTTQEERLTAVEKASKKKVV